MSLESNCPGRVRQLTRIRLRGVNRRLLYEKVKQEEVSRLAFQSRNVQFTDASQVP